MARIIVVTSGKGGVGKTTSSAAIATGLAQKGKKTVVIDFDIGLRNLDLIMGCERRVVYDFVNVIQGDATLNGAEYTLYKSGKAVATYTVKNGTFTTELFPCTADDGVYTLKETKAPTGYKLDETVYKLKTSYDHYSDAENTFSVTVSDPVMYGKIQLTKYAMNTVSGDKQPEEGATFTVYLKSAGSYDAAKDSERDIITIGKDGKGTSKSLPYGTYCVQQRTGWAGSKLSMALMSPMHPT